MSGRFEHGVLYKVNESWFLDLGKGQEEKQIKESHCTVDILNLLSCDNWSLVCTTVVPLADNCREGYIMKREVRYWRSE